MKLSAVIITYNEEKYIRQCIESVKDLVDEIVVLDSFSTDDTESICKSYSTLRFFQQKFVDFGSQKNAAVALAKNEWILSLDADEYLSPKLREEIKQLQSSESNDRAYSLLRLNQYCGRWIKHSGWNNDKQLRIWNRQFGTWCGNVHERVKLDSHITEIVLDGMLMHKSIDSISDHLKIIDKYTTLAAEKQFEAGKKPGVIKALVSGFFKWVKMYFLQRGFLDGKEGFVLACNSAFYTYIKHIKTRELNLKSKS